MSARRFFMEGAHAPGDVVIVGDADAHKIRDVLRLRTGDEIDAIDSTGNVFRARVQIDAAAVRAHVDRLVAAARMPSVVVDVAQGIPKGQKMDFVVEKLTELGVNAILPLTSERAVVRGPGDSKVERWRRLAQSAAAQSGRTAIPVVEYPVTLEELTARFASYDCVLFPWEVSAGAAPLRDVLPNLVAGAGRILVIIGPEGGFSHAEAQRARSAGAHVLSLGHRILRTETAALVLVAILQYLFE